jgi:hypothetical protein
VNLHGDETYPIADALAARAIPFVFASGYSAGRLRKEYRGVPSLQKPYQQQELERTLAAALSRVGGRVLLRYAAGVPGILSSNLDLFAKISELLTDYASRTRTPELLWAHSPFSELGRNPNALRDWLGVQQQWVAQSAHIFRYLTPALS